MNQSPNKDLKRWARAWNVAGKRMEQLRVERLRTMTDEEARAEIARIFSGPVPERVERTCGLIEQQRLFRELA